MHMAPRRKPLESVSTKVNNIFYIVTVDAVTKPNLDPLTRVQ